MSTASKFAEQITEAIQQKSWMTDTADAVDVTLAPVRECLEGLRRDESCWCRKDHQEDGHTNACLAAQQLWERLKIQ